MNRLNFIRKMFFALPLSEANFENRGFLKKQSAQGRLEYVAKVVVDGYNTALETGLSDDLLVLRERVKKEDVGFYNEGIGMGLFTLDFISIVKKDRFWNFVQGKGKEHEYMSYIGAGIACGVFKILPIQKFIKRANPTCGLLLLNGIGFYYAYFKPKKTLGNNFFVPARLLKDPFNTYSYDNGIGRALWFVHGGSPESIEKNINKFPKNRQAGVWSGVGLAATYAGGVSQNVISDLIKRSGEYRDYLSEGSILAVHTRDIAGNPHQNNDTVENITGRKLEECTIKANELIDVLGDNQFIEDLHSLEYFFNEIRRWVNSKPEPALEEQEFDKQLNVLV